MALRLPSWMVPWLGSPERYTHESLAPVRRLKINEILTAQGIRLWNIRIPGAILDSVSLPVPQSGLSLIAVSTAGYGIRVYDGKHHVDTLKMSEPVSAMKVLILHIIDLVQTCYTCSIRHTSLENKVYFNIFRDH